MFGTPLEPKLNVPKRAVPGSLGDHVERRVRERGVRGLALGVDEEAARRTAGCRRPAATGRASGFCGSRGVTGRCRGSSARPCWGRPCRSARGRTARPGSSSGRSARRGRRSAPRTSRWPRRPGSRARLDRGEVVRVDRGAFGRAARDAVAERDVADLGVLARVGALDRDHGLAGVLVHGQRARTKPEAGGVRRRVGVGGGGSEQRAEQRDAATIMRRRKRSIAIQFRRTAREP